jgi:hypothetical protein
MNRLDTKNKSYLGTYRHSNGNIQNEVKRKMIELKKKNQYK